PAPEPPPEPAAGEGSQEPDPPGETDAAGQADEPAESPDEAAEPAPEAPEAGADGGDTEVRATQTRGTVEFADCEREYLCGTVTVPLDHDDPGSATVELAIGMLPAGDPDLRIGYLLANPGGPGGGMDGFLDFGAGLSDRLLSRFDVIGWDPRSVGGSVPSGCQAQARDLYLADPVPDTPAEEAELDAAARAVAEVCAANLGDAVAHIGTMDTVRDMDAIRRALGVETISYIGFSYGTLLGQLYADMFGGHLRAAVIDGVIDPSLSKVEVEVGQMVGFARAIDDMFAWCRTDPDCPVTGDPREAYERLLAEIDAEPLRDPAGTIVLDPPRAILAGVVASYASQIWPFYFQALADALDGDGSTFARLGEFYIDFSDLGAFSSIGCTDAGAATRAELEALRDQLAAAAGDFGRLSAVGSLPCEYWPLAAGTLPVGAIAAPDAPPILVVGNRGDNATPYEWAVSVAGQLASGVLVSYDGNDHTSYGLSDCVDRVVDDYLVDLVVPPADVDCPRES
ncbi:MAG: alpha/beta hydrolase, partial [Acidimicrobiia bacterium]|nr:alpha/beta hydrolase [Acidimicrobiia bacterium]